jgi:hypothetical protein
VDHAETSDCATASSVGTLCVDHVEFVKDDNAEAQLFTYLIVCLRPMMRMLSNQRVTSPIRFPTSIGRLAQRSRIHLAFPVSVAPVCIMFRCTATFGRPTVHSHLPDERWAAKQSK